MPRVFEDSDEAGMTPDQCKAIIKSVTGLDPDTHPNAIEIAWELGNKLIEACLMMDPG